MIAEANREIRWAFQSAEQEREERRKLQRPVAYLDQVIVSLEELHLKGHTVVPKSFMPRLDAVGTLLPPGVERPVAWRRHIARVIDQCFDLQEDVLRTTRKLEYDDVA